LDISIPSGDIRDRSLKLLEIASNFAHFGLRFFFFLGGEGPEFFDLYSKIEHTSDHASRKVSRRSADGARRSRAEKRLQNWGRAWEPYTWGCPTP